MGNGPTGWRGGGLGLGIELSVPGEALDGRSAVVVGGQAVEHGRFQPGVSGEISNEERIDAAAYQPGDERMPEGVGGQAIESG